jgi:alpha-1,2-mannosyltransferase
MSSGTLTVPQRKRSADTRRDSFRRAAENSLFGLVPVLATLTLVVFQFKLHAVAVDFRVAYYPAAHRLLQGLNPFAVTPSQIAAGTGFVYPALSALLFAPFALIGEGAAGALYMLICIACVPAILRTLNVRDWRVYGLSMLWFPVFDGWQSGNVTLPLTLLVALTWRHRDRPWVAGVLTAAAISIKPFVWPLALWLLATRRWKAAAWAIASGVAFNLLAWGLVGFNEISTFLHLSSEDTRALWKGGYSVLAVAHHLGLGRSAGEGLLVAAAIAAAAVLVYIAAVKRRERDALVLAIVLMLLASPLLWAHYFALLLVPLALCCPRLGVVWALPVLMWPMPPRQPVYGWEEVLAWGVTALCVWIALRQRRHTTGDRDELRIAETQPV